MVEAAHLDDLGELYDGIYTVLVIDDGFVVVTLHVGYSLEPGVLERVP